MKYRNSKHKLRKLELQSNQNTEKISNEEFKIERITFNLSDVNNTKYSNRIVREFDTDWTPMDFVHKLSGASDPRYAEDGKTIYKYWQVLFENIPTNLVDHIRWTILYDSQEDFELGKTDYNTDVESKTSHFIEIKEIEDNENRVNATLKVLWLLNKTKWGVFQIPPFDATPFPDILVKLQVKLFNPYLFY